MRSRISAVKALERVVAKRRGRRAKRERKKKGEERARVRGARRRGRGVRERGRENLSVENSIRREESEKSD